MLPSEQPVVSSDVAKSISRSIPTAPTHILDAPDTIWVFQGSACSPGERAASARLAGEIEALAKERGRALNLTDISELLSMPDKSVGRNTRKLRSEFRSKSHPPGTSLTTSTSLENLTLGSTCQTLHILA